MYDLRDRSSVQSAHGFACHCELRWTSSRATSAVGGIAWAFSLYAARVH